VNFLAFAPEAMRIGSRRVRAYRFEDRSLLPVSAACVVANGIREALGALFAATVNVRLFEPLLPDPSGWEAIGRDARVYGVRGSRADGAIVVRATDASRLAGAAFGETQSSARALSEMEATVLERIVGALGAQLAPVCGTTQRPSVIATLQGFSTYFEVELEAPIHARVGIALARDPVEQHAPSLTLDDLRSVEVEVSVRLGAERLAAGALAGLAVGAVLPLGRAAATPGIAYLAGRALARGECGVVRDRYALSIGTLIDEGSGEPSL